MRHSYMPYLDFIWQKKSLHQGIDHTETEKNKSKGTIANNQGSKGERKPKLCLVIVLFLIV